MTLEFDVTGNTTGQWYTPITSMSLNLSFYYFSKIFYLNLILHQRISDIALVVHRLPTTLTVVSMCKDR